MPILGGVAHHPDGGHGDGHEDGHHDAAAVFVGPDAQRHTHQRAGEHRHGGEQAELRGAQVQHLPDRNADDAKHHPDHEADGERQGADDEHRPGAALLLRVVMRNVRATCGGRHRRFDHVGAFVMDMAPWSGFRARVNILRQEACTAAKERRE
ncbi:hypothetical protein SDC9_69875 [bioreactor metagenome]|uniref:Uncharacterized protein n=1 Tax=bioreactor metagenome TaxID=1076179 RepID=A0A644YA03_9ZZZZ